MTDPETIPENEENNKTARTTKAVFLAYMVPSEPRLPFDS
jgi:hypothetical protein